jgi:hypothetical protein
MPRRQDHPILADRRAAANIVRKHEFGFKVWTWEDCNFPGRFPPKDLFLSQASKAKLLILLIHNRLTPNTELEYKASLKQARSQMILFRDGCRLTPDTLRFQKKLNASTYCRYRNRSELRTLILRGLTNNVWLYANRGLEARLGTSTAYAGIRG